MSGFALAVALLPLMTVVLASVRGDLSFSDDLLIYLLAVLAVTCVGGLWPAVATAVAGCLCLNYYFTPPIHRWTIDSPQNFAALLLFIAAAVTFSAVVHVAARESAASRRAAAESQDLVQLAQTVLREDDADAVLRHLAATRGIRAVLEERDGRDGREGTEVWLRVAGDAVDDATPSTTVDVRPNLRLRAAVRDGEARRVVEGAAAQAAAALDRSRLRVRAAEVEALAQADRMRTALLAAVSHDLRTPLAAVKAGVSSLRQTDVDWSAADHDDLVLTIEEGADRLEHIVNNLLDMSRVQTGTVAPLVRPMALDEVLPLALAGLDIGRVDIDVPEDLPLVVADPGLLERAVANVVGNALKFSPPQCRVGVTAHRVRDQVALVVIDHGPGVARDARDEMFVPFRQMGDRRQSGGVGLGLAVARGFVEAMAGDITASATPGGGLTMTVRLPAAAAQPVAR